MTTELRIEKLESDVAALMNPEEHGRLLYMATHRVFTNHFENAVRERRSKNLTNLKRGAIPVLKVLGLVVLGLVIGISL